MRTRRIAASACTLCLAIPAAAGASPAANPARAPSAVIPPGPGRTAHAKGPYGIVPPGPRSTVEAKGPYGIVLPGPRSAVEAKGPYGISPSGPRVMTKGINAPLHQSVGTAGTVDATGTSHHGLTGWGAAGVAGTALLAALALGCGLALAAHRRPPRMVT